MDGKGVRGGNKKRVVWNRLKYEEKKEREWSGTRENK